MTTLERTISMIKVLPETDLLEIQNLSQKLFQQHQADVPFSLKSREEIYKELEIARHQAAVGEYQAADEFIVKVREEYGI